MYKNPSRTSIFVSFALFLFIVVDRNGPSLVVQSFIYPGTTTPAVTTAYYTTNRSLVLHQTSSRTTALTAFRQQEVTGLNIAETSDIPPKDAADELLNLLLENKSGGDSFDDDKKTRIELLMQQLEAQRVPFDPETSLNGPLYAVLYQKGPVPFWVKYGKIRGFDLNTWLPNKEGKDEKTRMNLKGQRYLLTSDDDTTSETKEPTYDVTNYAEFFGKSLFIQASAVCERNSDQSKIINVSENTNNPLNSLTKWFSQTKNNSLSSMLPTPHDFTINVTGASISVLNRKLDFGISGTGYMRVLYADPQLRILTAPKDTTTDKDSIVQERAGLTVVQVRVDLIDPTFNLD